jgi:enamine deaminase RidA (YjgF/YER057c/UK114 family)
MAVQKEAQKWGNFMEDAYGFSQGVKVGNVIYISGQTAFMDDGSIDGPGDMAVQMRRAYANIAKVLEGFGAGPDNVVDETLYVADYMAAATVAHDVRKEFYGGQFEVASTLIPVNTFATPDMLIEIKCVAHL